MAQKRFEEYFAKVVLESCFPDKFFDLQVSDRPDLQRGTDIGVEVTNCMPTRVAEAFNLWYRVAKQGEQTPPRILERLEQLDEVQLVDDELIWMQGMYSQDESENFLKAVEKKVERLNSSNAGYAQMGSYELFVNSFISIPNYRIGEAIKRLQELNNKPKKFDFIYLLTNEQKLLIFDVLVGLVYPKHLYTWLDRMADKAKELYLGATNDET